MERGGPLTRSELDARRSARARARRRRARRRWLIALGVTATLIAGAVGAWRAQRSTSPRGGEGRAATLGAGANAAPGRGGGARPRHSLFSWPVVAGAGRRREIALTFDDGPGIDTPALLAVLRRLHVPATFFVVGTKVRSHPEVVLAERRDGFALGDHTVNHRYLARQPAANQRQEIRGVLRRLAKLGVGDVWLFRPPYGGFDATTLRVLRGLGMTMVLWTVGTGDYTRPGTAAIVSRVLAGARPGAIVLMHDGGGHREQTVAAVPPIVRALRARGYRLVTVATLLASDPPRGPPRTTLGGGG
jgi:peptidoglycan/xylan/chitin deacetylase (PgdA/CDA1 family)